jgi:hypothetical protein
MGIFLATPRPVQASCIAPAPLASRLDGASVVFVGTVISTSDRGRLATVRVEAVWKGPDLPPDVQMIGSLAPGPNSVTSVDRSYQAGRRYLFVPTNDRPPFQDNACTATQLYAPELAAYAPPGVRDARADQGLPGVPDRPWGRFWPLILPFAALAGLAVLAARQAQRSRGK